MGCAVSGEVGDSFLLPLSKPGGYLHLFQNGVAASGPLPVVPVVVDSIRADVPDDGLAWETLEPLLVLHISFLRVLLESV